MASKVVETIYLKRTYASFSYFVDVPLLGYVTGLSQVQQFQGSKKKWKILIQS